MEVVDVAIVGGGIAGIYSAWWLTQRYPGKTVRLYEADDHIGGRLLSVKPPKIDDMVADLGGTRISSSATPSKVSMRVVLSLCSTSRRP